jgi:pyruvate dehydrogenase E2 component (dihydrolipoamide acetyltransferase)
MRGLRRSTARRMTTAWREVPHVNSVHEVDLHQLLTLRARLAEAGHRVPLTAFLVKATAMALTEWPSLNATVDDEAEEITYHERVDLAVAADTDDGLLVPVLRGVDRSSLARVGRELTEAMGGARDRTLTPEAMRGATFTVNNYGPLGGWFGTSLVSPGQVGILSMGPARDRVVPVDGEIAIRPVAVLALAADHRVADGRELIGFCVSVRERLENPLSLLMDG